MYLSGLTCFVRNMQKTNLVQFTTTKVALISFKSSRESRKQEIYMVHFKKKKIRKNLTLLAMIVATDCI